MFNSHAYKAALAAGLILIGSIGMFAEDKKKEKESAPAKPAVTKPQPAAKAAPATDAHHSAPPSGATHNFPSAPPSGATHNVPSAPPSGATHNFPSAPPSGATHNVPSAPPSGATHNVPSAPTFGTTHIIPGMKDSAPTSGATQSIPGMKDSAPTSGATHGTPGMKDGAPTSGATHGIPDIKVPSPGTHSAASPTTPNVAPTHPGMNIGTHGATAPATPFGEKHGGKPSMPHSMMNTGIHGTTAPVGAHVQTFKNGNAFQRRPDGHISDVHDARHGMDIHHGLNGGRRVLVVRADHSRVFAEHGRRAFIERPYSFRGHDFARRNYYYHGKTYASYYRGFRFRGLDFHVYAPARYYPVSYYGWAYHPWARPVIYAWGPPAPWASYYGFYFAPYRSYPTASAWLTDYMIREDLAAAYEAGRDSATLAPEEQAGRAPVMTPEVKQMIAEEVRSQIALENAEAQQNAANQEIDPASSSIARTLADGRPHVFLVGSPLDVVDESGGECALSEGDALQMAFPPEPTATTADMVVLASKGRTECSKSATVSVALADIQEMQNHMREAIDRGMGELRDKQGKGGLPAAPVSARSEPVSSGFAEVAPPPDPNDLAAIDQQMRSADQTEQDVTAQGK